jgi:hypothetical protein
MARISGQAALLAVGLSLSFGPALANPAFDISLVQSIEGTAANSLYVRSPGGGWRQPSDDKTFKVLREVSSGGSTLVLEEYPGETLHFDFDASTIALRECPEHPIKCTVAPMRIDTIKSFSYRLPKSLHALKNLDQVEAVYLPAQVVYQHVSLRGWRRVDGIATRANQPNAGITQFGVSSQSQSRITLLESPKPGTGGKEASVVIDLAEARVFETWPGKATVFAPILDVGRIRADPTLNVVALSPDQAAASHAPIRLSRANQSIIADGSSLTLTTTSSLDEHVDGWKFALERRPARRTSTISAA